MGFGGVAMAEDGTGGVVYLKRSKASRTYSSRASSAALAGADPGGSRPALRRRAGRASAPPTTASWSSSGPRRSRPKRKKARNGPSTSCSARRSAPAPPKFGPRSDHRPGHRRCHRHQPRSGDELDQPGRRGLPGGQLERDEFRCCVPATSTRKCGSRTINGERWLDLGADQPRPRRLDAPADAGQRPPDRDRPDAATASSSGRSRKSTGSRASGRGACSGRASTTCCPSARRVSKARRSKAKPTRRASAISLLGQAEVAYRQAAGAELAAARPAHLPEHAARRRIGERSGVHGRRRSPTPAVSGGAAAKIGPPSIDVDEQREMRLLYDANGAPRVVEGNDKAQLPGNLSLGPPFTGREEPCGERDEPRRRGRLGVGRAPSRTDTPAVAVREDFPGGAVQTALVGGGAGGDDR